MLVVVSIVILKRERNELFIQPTDVRARGSLESSPKEGGRGHQVPAVGMGINTTGLTIDLTGRSEREAICASTMLT